MKQIAIAFLIVFYGIVAFPAAGIYRLAKGRWPDWYSIYTVGTDLKSKSSGGQI